MLSLVSNLSAELSLVGGSNVFEGFKPLSFGLLVTDGTNTYSLGSVVPATFTPLDGQPTIHFARGRHPSIVANSTTEIDGLVFATVVFDKKDPPPVERLAAIAAHEAFHVFQSASFPAWRANEASLFTYPYTNLESETSKVLELWALDRALTVRNDQHGWLRTHLGLRSARYDSLVAAAVEYEREIERYEGLARYVENKVLGVTPTPLLEFSPHEVRLRGYAVGERLAVLLDEMRPGWQRQMLSNPHLYLDDLALESAGEKPATFSPDEVGIARHKASLAIERLLVERSKEMESFQAASGWQLTLTPQEPLLLQGFDPMNVVLLEDGSVLHKRYLSLGNDEIHMEFLDVTSLTTPVGPHPLFNGVRSVKLTSLPTEPVLREANGRTTINASGVTISLITAAARIALASN